MIDFAKKIRKACASDLEVGETVIAGTFVQPAGAIRRQVTFAYGGVIGAVVGEKLAAKSAESSGDANAEGLVLEIPPGKAVLGITDRRFLVFGHSTMSGKPKGLNAAIPLDQIATITHESGKLTGKLIVTFVDEGSIDFDVVKTAKPGPFVEAFHTATGR